METCVNCGTSRPDEQMLHSRHYDQWACLDPELCYQAQAATGSTFISLRIGEGHLSAERIDAPFPPFVDLGDGWYQRDKVVSRYEHGVLTTLDLAKFER